jgi:hypothetical protein
VLLQFKRRKCIGTRSGRLLMRTLYRGNTSQFQAMDTPICVSGATPMPGQRFLLLVCTVAMYTSVVNDRFADQMSSARCFAQCIPVPVEL